MEHLRRFVASVVVFTVFITACGGGGDTSVFTSSSDASSVNADLPGPTEELRGVEPSEVAEALVEAHGPDGAFAALLYALDAGYSGDQVVAAAMDGSLGADGVIKGVEPALASYELVSAPSDELEAQAGVLASFVPGARVAAVGDGDGVTPELAEMAFMENLLVNQTKLEAVSFIARGWGLQESLTAEDIEPMLSNPRDESPEMTDGFATVLLGIVVGLVLVGYSFEDTLLGLMAGEWDATTGVDETANWRDWPAYAEVGGHPAVVCPVLRNSSGAVVPPTGSASRLTSASGLCARAIAAGTIYRGTERERFADREPPKDEPAPPPDEEPATPPDKAEDPALAFPRTYEGGGKARWSFSFPPPGSCVVEDTLELTLKADGTLDGLYTRTSPTFVGKPGDDPTSLECGEQFFVDELEVAGRHTPPGPEPSETGSVVVEIVGWPDWHIEGEYTPGEMTFVWELDYPATGYEGDEPDPQVINAVDFMLRFADEG